MPETTRLKLACDYSQGNQKHVINGCIFSKESSGSHHKFASCAPTLVNFDEKIPPMVDLRKYYMAEVQDTGDSSTCVTHAIVAALEYFHYLCTSAKIKLSSLCLYYYARQRGLTYSLGIIQDKGCSIESALAAYCENGICQECHWKFDSRFVNRVPLKSNGCKEHRDLSFDYEKISNSLQIIKFMLHKGYPIVAGLLIDRPFYKARKKNGRVVGNPYLCKTSTEKRGEHAMLIVGYIDSWKVFIVRNCWGPSWGDNGYCYMPYNYITDTKLCPELFVLKSSAVENLSGVHRIDNDDDFTLYGASSADDDDDDDSIAIVSVDVSDDDDDDDSTGSSQTEKDDDAKKHVIKNYVV